MNKTFWSVLLSTAVIASAPARGDSSFESFRRALIDYFEPESYLPVIVDRGYSIGDVVNIDGVNLYARAARCFPHLQVPDQVKTSLPGTVYAYDIGMSFGLRLRQLFDSQAGADLKRQVEIRFSDVHSVSVALLDLRDALDRAVCPAIVPLIDGTLEALRPGQKSFFIVSELLIGKSEARLQFATNADLELKTKNIVRQIGYADLSVRAANEGGVVLKNEIAAPIAIKPVTVPKVVTLYSFNGVRGYEEEQKLRWVPVKCEGAETCIRDFNPFFDLVRAAVPSLSNDEIDR